MANTANTIKTVTEKLGVPAVLELNIPTSLGLQGLALYTNLRDNNDLYHSDTSIVYIQGQPLKVVDPNGYFGDVKFDLTSKNNLNTADYKITFLKPMTTSDIYFRMWDSKLESSDWAVYSAWQAVQPPGASSSSQTSPLVTTASQSAASTQNSPQPQNQADSELTQAIKDWGGYSSNAISDEQFLNDLGLKGQHIPSWVSKTTKWVVDGELSQDEFINAVKYLSEKGLIK